MGSAGRTKLREVVDMEAVRRTGGGGGLPPTLRRREAVRGPVGTHTHKGHNTNNKNNNIRSRWQ